MTDEKVSIIINTYPRVGRDKDLRRCLDSLKKQSYQNFKIIVVENFNSDLSVNKVIKSYCGTMEMKVVFNPVKRLSLLFNIGWKQAKTEIIGFLADDTKADSHWLENIVEELSLKNDVGAVSGPVVSSCFPTGEMHRLYLRANETIWGRLFIRPYLYFSMDDSPTLPGKYFSSGSYSFGSALPESINFKRQEIDLLTTTNMGIRKSALEKLDGFDEDFNFNHADGDLFLRLRKMGYKLVFNPKIMVRHFVRLGPSRNAYFIGKDTGIFHRKHLRPDSIKSMVGAVMNIAVLNIYWLYSGIHKRDLSQLKGISGYVEGVLRK